MAQVKIIPNTTNLSLAVPIFGDDKCTSLDLLPVVAWRVEVPDDPRFEAERYTVAYPVTFESLISEPCLFDGRLYWFPEDRVYRSAAEAVDYFTDIQRRRRRPKSTDEDLEEAF
jgi:hypothetical protein